MNRGFLFTALAIFVQTSGLTCSCGPNPPVAEAIAQAKVVFAGRCISGKLLSKRLPDGTQFDFREFTFDIDRAWKGADGRKQIAVESLSGMGDCGYSFEVGHSYIVYAFDATDHLQTTVCSRTTYSGFHPITWAHGGDITVEAHAEIEALDKATNTTTEFK